MKTSRLKCFLSITAACLLFAGSWASAGNLPSWGGAQPQVQQPSQTIPSQPAANTAQTVQAPQPGTWTAPGTTSSPTVSTPEQQQGTQPATTAPVVKPSAPVGTSGTPKWQVRKPVITAPAAEEQTVTDPEPTAQQGGAEAILPRLTGRKAGIIFSYMGDSPFKSFFQETVRLKKIMELYDFNVLLKHDNVEPWLDWSEQDERIVNVKDVPTKQNLFSYIKRLADEGYTIDIWIISHGGPDGSFRASFGQYSQQNNDLVRPADIQALAGPDGGATGYQVLPIRLVHHTSCWGSRLASAWRGIGANTVIGSRFVNFYPTQTVPFAKQWMDGRSAVDAYRYANTATSRTVVQTWMVADAAGSKKEEWGGCSFGNTVLGKKTCAKNYFIWRGYFSEAEWSAALSGKENMNRSSEMLISGDANVRRNTTWRQPTG